MYRNRITLTVGCLAAIVSVSATALSAASKPNTVKPGTAMVLAGNGFAVGGKTAKFGVTTKAQAIALVTAAQGKPTEQGSHGDCGQGDVIGYAKFRGDFELSFVKGKLSGWTADRAPIKTGKGIAVGATLAALRKAYPDVETDPGDEAHGGLGPSFQREDGPSGSLDGTKPSAKITGLFAGATCLAGI